MSLTLRKNTNSVLLAMTGGTAQREPVRGVSLPDNNSHIYVGEQEPLCGEEVVFLLVFYNIIHGSAPLRSPRLSSLRRGCNYPSQRSFLSLKVVNSISSNQKVWEARIPLGVCLATPRSPHRFDLNCPLGTLTKHRLEDVAALCDFNVRAFKWLQLHMGKGSSVCLSDSHQSMKKNRAAMQSTWGKYVRTTWQHLELVHTRLSLFYLINNGHDQESKPNFYCRTTTVLNNFTVH